MVSKRTKERPIGLQKGNKIMNTKRNPSTTAALVIAASILVLPAVAVAQTDGSQVGSRLYRPATTRAVRGFDRIVTGDGTALFLADALHVRGVSPESTRARSGKTGASTLSLGADDAASLAALVRDAGVDRLAVVEGDRFVGTVAIVSIDVHGTVVSGLRVISTGRREQSSTPTDAVSPLGTQVTIIPRTPAVRSGQSITVDVYASGAGMLRTYQVAVDAVGADGSKLELQSAQVDRTRQDHVFFGKDALDAADLYQGRVGAVLFYDSASADEAKYLGSFTFAADANAAGTYHLTIRRQDSFLNDAERRDLRFAVQGATVEVGLDVSDRAIR